MLGAQAPGRGETDVEIVPSPLTRGVILPADGLAVITEEEVFGGRAHKKRERKNKDTTRPFLEDLRSLSFGDLVVHVEHGVRRYLGLVHKPVGGHLVDLLVVEYAGKDKLYLPVYRLNQVQKLSGGEGESTKLDRLGGSTFSKTKARVRKEVRQMADELLRLYAERKAQLGTALAPVDDEYRAFEATFPFEETPDLARAIDDVNRDLEAPRPMDRLVCGDVGFGKTEVAIRRCLPRVHVGPPGVPEAVNALHEARILPRLNPEQKSQLEANLVKSPEMLDTVNKLSRLANGNRDLSAAAIEGMALVKNPSDKTADAIAALIPDAQIEQAYQTLVTKAALKANSWNAETQANFLFLLTEANARIARGSSVKEAMEQANAELARAKGVRLDVKEINKYCL